MRRTVRGYGLLILLPALLGACEAVERVRSGAQGEDGGASATAGGLTLALQIPGMLHAGDEGTIRLSLTNHGDSVPGNVRLDLIVPGWMELAPPRPGDREVTMAAEEGEGTRFSYRMDEPPLGPGETQLLEQRVRVPAQSPPGAGRGLSSRLIRARLVNARGQTLTEVQSEVTLDSAFMGAAGAAAAEAAEPRTQLGAARIGMSSAALRQAVSNARDTTWSQEGMTERGVVLPMQGGQALAVLSGDSVARIEVRDEQIRTREGLGVGSTLGELRNTWGRTCAGAGEGIVVVWFPSAPGLSFALDTPFATIQQARENPERIPATARVTRWWLHTGTSDCPVSGG
jgi:hypothetical protein